MSKPKCPVCGSTKAAPQRGKALKCNRCGTMFDTDPNEGGDYHADPSRRLQQQEREDANRRRDKRR